MYIKNIHIYREQGRSSRLVGSLLGMEEVGGSNPPRSTNKINK